MSRGAAIAAFLAASGHDPAAATPLAAEASLRRYLRVSGEAGGAVLMDAPPPHDVRPFLRIRAHLENAGLSVPALRAADPEAGLLLLEDFGDDLLGAPAQLRPAPFAAAAEALAAMQAVPPPPGLPPWNAGAMREAVLGTLLDWWWPAMFSGPAPLAARDDIAATLTDMLAPLDEAPQVFVHRDYFADNLIWLPQRAGARRVGLLDFQGAALGHPAYDLVSLIEDERRDIAPGIAGAATAAYLAAARPSDPERFQAAFAVCAAHRHLRCATQWVRLARRDGLPRYLAHGPRSWRLLAAALRHPATAPLASALDRWIPEACRANPPVALKSKSSRA